MNPLILMLQFLAGLVTLACFVIVLIKMFQSGEQAMGIVCIVLIFCGIGFLVAFVYGWMKASKWKIKNLMWIWTAALIAGFLLGGISLATGTPMLPARP